MIYINNVALADYNPNLYNYDITLPAGSDAPLVTYKPGYTTQSITVEQASSPEGTAYIHVNGDATYSLYFTEDGGGSQQGDELVTFALDTNWHFIMLPQFGGINYEDIMTDSEVLWAIYDGEQRAGGQSGWKIVDFVTTYYKDWAHIVRAVEGNATLTINLKGNKNNQPINFELRHFDASHAENANWNFIGNPYYAGYDINGLVAAGIESPITVWNGTGYNIYTPGIDQYTLQPFEPFFIQLSDDQQSGSIQLSPEYVDESMSLIDSGNGGNGSDPSGSDGVADAYGALPGYFSVGEGVQVQFSRGNLQYQASTDTWRFAENQYDHAGEDNANISESYEGWIDLFSWGTGDNPTNTIMDAAEYGFYNEWGDNPISNGGNVEGLWRTLTNDEWLYLTQSRMNATELFGAATVNGINGMVILPDGWSDVPDIFTFNPGWNAYSQNPYTYEEWSKMESAGAVFLPTTGSRSGTDIDNVETDGCYWLSTTFISGNYTHAYDFCFDSRLFTSPHTINRSYGRSVRLVK